jgi:hypothetical protein
LVRNLAGAEKETPLCIATTLPAAYLPSFFRERPGFLEKFNISIIPGLPGFASATEA